MLHLPSLTNCRILVVGDVMLDQYWLGATARISPEAPVPVCAVKQTTAQPGGAGNVAMNTQAMGAQTTLLCALDDGEDATTLKHVINEQGINLSCVPATTPAIKKLRVVSQNQQLLRLDFDNAVAFSREQFLAQFAACLAETDVVILSDYGKGTLIDVQAIIELARAAQKPVLVDPKGTDFSRYAGADCITPNLKEFQAVVGECSDETSIIERARLLIEAHDLQSLLITRSSDGMTIVDQSAQAKTFPVVNHEVFDVTGAGDTVIAALACCLAANCSLSDSVQLANIAASCVVAKFGAASLSWAEWSAAAAARPHVGSGVISEEQCISLSKQAKAQGRRIVMTNGCFDILHLGHITYLKQARALGDMLIIAVNDDASVARLKGPSRPINDLNQRMAILAELDCVDAVLAFSEDTPARLIKAIMPDVLVKGGDYEVTQIAGHEAVIANGGRVEILPFVPGRSTTDIIASISKEQA